MLLSRLNVNVAGFAPQVAEDMFGTGKSLHSSNGGSALMVAAAGGHLEVVGHLAGERGADLCCMSPHLCNPPIYVVLYVFTHAYFQMHDPSMWQPRTELDGCVSVCLPVCLYVYIYV